MLFTFNPYVGCGPYKLHSFDPQGSWTAWEKREDWDKSPTGMMYGEPKPKYIIFQFFDNEGAQILSQLNHELDVAELSADGLKALLAQSQTSRLPANLPLRGQQRPGHHRHRVQHRPASIRPVGCPLGVAAGDRDRGIHEHRCRFLGNLEPGAHPAPWPLP